ncbi:hypothetical protein AA313_de0207402 [Arthrobotrys entomopaga]|nr:hypothetical protein AA313_de0207402 [Arthrobotrys entomopaga]
MASRDLAGDLADAIPRLLPQKIAEQQEIQNLGEEYFAENSSSADDLDPTVTAADRLNNVFIQYLKTLETEIPLHIDEYLQEEIENLTESKLDSKDRPAGLGTEESVFVHKPDSQEDSLPANFIFEISIARPVGEIKNASSDAVGERPEFDAQAHSNSKGEPIVAVVSKPIVADNQGPKTTDLDAYEVVSQTPEENTVINTILESDTESKDHPLPSSSTKDNVHPGDDAILPISKDLPPIKSQNANDPVPSISDQKTSISDEEISASEASDDKAYKAPSHLTPTPSVAPQDIIPSSQTPSFTEEEATARHIPTEQQDLELADSHPEFPDPITTGSQTEASNYNLPHRPTPSSQDLDSDVHTDKSEELGQSASKTSTYSLPEEGAGPEPIKNVLCSTNTNASSTLEVELENDLITEPASNKTEPPADSEPTPTSKTEVKAENTGDLEIAGATVIDDVTEESPSKGHALDPEISSTEKPDGGSGGSETSQSIPNGVQSTGNNGENAKTTSPDDSFTMQTHTEPQSDQVPKPRDTTPAQIQTESTESPKPTEPQESRDPTENESTSVIANKEDGLNDETHIAQKPQRKPLRTKPKPNKLLTKFEKATEGAYKKSPIPEQISTTPFEEPPDLDELPWNPYNGDYSTADLRRSKGRQHHRKHSSIHFPPPTPKPDTDSEDELPVEEPEEDDLDLDDNIKKGNAKLRKSAKSKHHNNIDSPQADSPDRDLPSPTTRRKGAPPTPPITPLRSTASNGLQLHLSPFNHCPPIGITDIQKLSSNQPEPPTNVSREGDGSLFSESSYSEDGPSLDDTIPNPKGPGAPAKSAISDESVLLTQPGLWEPVQAFQVPAFESTEQNQYPLASCQDLVSQAKCHPGPAKDQDLTKGAMPPPTHSKNVEPLSAGTQGDKVFASNPGTRSQEIQAAQPTLGMEEINISFNLLHHPLLRLPKSGNISQMVYLQSHERQINILEKTVGVDG